MAKYKIAVLPGDGVGVEVTEAAMIVLKKLGLDAEYTYGDIGWEFWCKEGDPLPQRTIDLLKQNDACLFGAITSKPKDEAAGELCDDLKNKGLVYRSPIVRLRQLFDLHTNLRPCKAYPGNPLVYKEGIDLVVFRENTEGLYGGVEWHPVPENVRAAVDSHPAAKKFASCSNDDMAISTRIFTRKGCQRILRSAFEFAKEHNRKSVTIVEKPNVIRETSGLMVREGRKMAKEYPDIQLWEANIDAMCMWLIKNPFDYDVLVSSNMFGDIISDLCAQLVGGLGFASAANIGDEFAVFEPTHGSAPKYAGQYKVNPMAMLLTVKLMLDWLGEKEMAERTDKAIAAVIAEGKVRTYDMGGSNTTLEVGEAVAERL
ncbi:isocitrate/isopropylmalate dehydrogenase family protein [candidate division WOR-3 bacterium]|uniref:Isocitrate/isopropylmalate dehydrogenase family protein n=1 Tax=candidate division WOR-3 bacterium TaxID=2052148 RepID=A0A9D5KAU9_UNCW3|nr:isocitrate/isopropylmalate dehydrogenase family protein [candidate division WOR-3 bacterium]MBD3365300.1 isocitrate/isopropylmalate dehydrogenase family protein [candidate division WOR-3 bacterium]